MRRISMLRDVVLSLLLSSIFLSSSLSAARKAQHSQGLRRRVLTRDSSRELESSPDDCPSDLYSVGLGTKCSTHGLVCVNGEECCCGECSPSYICTCVNGEFECLFSEFCFGVPFDENGNEICPEPPPKKKQPIDLCPADPLVTAKGNTACSSQQTCDYGQECCCGKCAPEIECTCGENGKYSCGYTDFCYGIPFDKNGKEICPEPPAPPATRVCPTDPSVAAGSSCSPEGQVCEIGQKCCCGDCSPEIRCECRKGIYLCAPAHACNGTPLDRKGNYVCESEKVDEAERIEQSESKEEDESCPATLFDATISTCSVEGRRCEFGGQQCCCGECAAEVQCTCQNTGYYKCDFTRFCWDKLIDANGNFICN